jgi:hypothetical protein
MRLVIAFFVEDSAVSRSDGEIFKVGLLETDLDIRDQN